MKYICYLNRPTRFSKPGPPAHAGCQLAARRQRTRSQRYISAAGWPQGARAGFDIAVEGDGELDRYPKPNP